MVEKVKIHLDKKKKMFSVDYSKVSDKAETRYQLLKAANESNDFMLLLDATLHHLEKLDVDMSPGLSIVEQQNAIKILLSNFGLSYIVHTRECLQSKNILGVSIGKTENVRALALLVYIPRGALSKDFFQAFIQKNDVMLGIGLTKEPEILFQEFSDREWQLVTESDGFTTTLFDSLLLNRFYTGFDYRSL